MPRTVSATEAKNTLGSLIRWVNDCKDDVIVERQGKPYVAIISFAEYEQVKLLREQKRRQEAIATLRALRDKVSARNADMTPEEVDEFANRVRHDVVQGLIDKGTIRFVE